jgi:hypothetical protein
MGAIQDRTREHLGTTDKVIIANRRMLVRAIETVQAGAPNVVTGGDVWIPQAEWNVDPMDGTGPSGITLDERYPNLLVIDGQWQGIGRVRFGFSIDGVTRYVHQFIHANSDGPLPYVQSFTLPCRWEIESTAASAGSTMSAACVDVVSEGGVSSPNGLTFAAQNAANVAT